MSYTSDFLTGRKLAFRRLRRPVGGGIKRTLDVIVALTAIVGLLPLFAGCYLLVTATSSGPVLFRHRRIGFRGQSFGCLKFRTMQVDAEDRLQAYLARNPEAHREWEANHKLRFDPRITPVGQFMRRSSLDELPQLFNVLLGHMSMVGPRPIVEDEVPKFRDNFSVYVSGRPGLTGLWQVKGRNTTSYDQRVAYDVEYLKNWSLRRDIKILVVTCAHVVEGKGAY